MVGREPNSFVPTEKAAKLLGGKVYISESRVKIAQIVDNIFMKTVMLFDSATIKRFELYVLGRGRIHIFQKMQTLFQMGKKKEFLELLDYIEKSIPELRELANSPDIFITADGKMLDEKESIKVWKTNRPIPKRVQKFFDEGKMWEPLLKDLEKKNGRPVIIEE